MNSCFAAGGERRAVYVRQLLRGLPPVDDRERSQGIQQEAGRVQRRALPEGSEEVSAG